MKFDDFLHEYSRTSYENTDSDCIVTRIVKSSRVVGGFKPKHVVYDLVTEVPNKFCFQVSRRYTDFAALSKVLRNIDPVAPYQEIPGKYSILDHILSLQWGSYWESKLVDKRRCMFQRFLTKALIYPKIRNSHVIHEFLTNPNDWIEVLRTDILLNNLDKLVTSNKLKGANNFDIELASDVSDEYLKRICMSMGPFYEGVHRASGAIKDYIEGCRTYAQDEENIALTYNTSSLSGFDISPILENLSHTHHNSHKNYLDLICAVEKDSFFPLLSISLTKKPIENVFRTYMDYKREFVIMANDLYTIRNTCKPFRLKSSHDQPASFSSDKDDIPDNKSAESAKLDQIAMDCPEHSNKGDKIFKEIENHNTHTTNLLPPQHANYTTFKDNPYANNAPLFGSKEDFNENIANVRYEYEAADKALEELTANMKSSLKLHRKICKREIKNVLMCFAMAQVDFHKKNLKLWSNALEQLNNDQAQVSESETSP